MIWRPFACLSAVLLAACQPAADASSPPVATATVAPAPAASVEPTAATSATAQPTAAPTAAAEAGPAPGSPEALARKLLKEGGATFSASKRSFLYLTSFNEEGAGEGKKIDIVGEDGKRDAIDFCQPGQCEAKGAELAKALEPKLAARLREGGYVPVTLVPWPSDKKELEVAGLGKLQFKKDHVELTPANSKKPTPMAKLKSSPPHKPEPSYVVVSPDGSLFGVSFTFDPGAKYGQGFNVFSELHLYRAR